MTANSPSSNLTSTLGGRTAAPDVAVGRGSSSQQGHGNSSPANHAGPCRHHPLRCSAPRLRPRQLKGTRQRNQRAHHGDAQRRGPQKPAKCWEQLVDIAMGPRQPARLQPSTLPSCKIAPCLGYWYIFGMFSEPYPTDGERSLTGTRRQVPCCSYLAPSGIRGDIADMRNWRPGWFRPCIAVSSRPSSRQNLGTPGHPHREQSRHQHQDKVPPAGVVGAHLRLQIKRHHAGERDQHLPIEPSNSGNLGSQLRGWKGSHCGGLGGTLIPRDGPLLSLRDGKISGPGRARRGGVRSPGPRSSRHYRPSTSVTGEALEHRER